ncbi:HAD family hydrolase [Streptomyces sp. NPDC058457]|uniref:HAD family hydrolase n=1 Tax=Streptomyces sp. NPDC058457 TaxID=3346507 RepID=UPI003646E344
MSVIFFDIGETLAVPHVDPDGSLRLQPLPRVVAVLDALGEVRKGIISNPGTDDGAAARAASALAQAFPGRFTDEALVHWGAKDSREIFDRAVASTGGATADDCVFVGENARERAFAREAGMRTATHPVFTVAAMENRPVFRVRIELPGDQDQSALTAAMSRTEAVPVQVVSQRLVVATATTRGTEVLESAGFTVDVQGGVEELAATEKFVSDLLARGEAVFEGEEPTPETTHVVKREDDGRLTVRRLRFVR